MIIGLFILMGIQGIALLWRISKLENLVVDLSSKAINQNGEIIQLTKAVGAIALQARNAVVPKE